MKLIVGLGNPGEEYTSTRHNAGFMFVDILQARWNFPVFEFHKKFNADLSRGKFQQEDIILVKPQALMNLSGESVKKILDFYKFTPKDILVIHDDLDIAMGNYKVATNSSSAGHNGVQNIIDQLGMQNFQRIRIGIGQAKEDAIVCRVDAHDFVLGKFSKEEMEKIKSIESSVLEEVEKFLSKS